ncbi:hypothetical protein L7F22_018775 [Adiantum nelumboides]|nr:hypothetical protein [Adiantum nelumboides]
MLANQALIEQFNADDENEEDEEEEKKRMKVDHLGKEMKKCTARSEEEVKSLHSNFSSLLLILRYIPDMNGQDERRECSMTESWIFSVAACAIAVPVGIRRKSLAPLVFYGTTGAMLDIIMSVSACEREFQQRQQELLLQKQQQDPPSPAFGDDGVVE